MSAGAFKPYCHSLPPRPRVFNPWLIALAVVVPTFLEVRDTTLANVALRYNIAGGLSAAVTDSEWVITSYLAIWLTRLSCQSPALVGRTFGAA